MVEDALLLFEHLVQPPDVDASGIAGALEEGKGPTACLDDVVAR